MWDSHLHLDYYFTGQDDEIKNESGTLFESIDLWNNYKKGNPKEEMKVHDKLKDSITMRVVVFPQNSLFSYTEDGNWVVT